MRRLARRSVLATCLGVLTSGAMAQPMGPGGGPGYRSGGPGYMGGPHGPMMGRGGGGMGYRFADPASYLDALKSELGIAATQEKAWNEYAAVVNGAAAQMRAIHQSMWESMYNATWEERRDMMNRTFRAREQAFKMVEDAAKALMPALSERQQGKADIVLPGTARRGGYRYHWR